MDASLNRSEPTGRDRHEPPDYFRRFCHEASFYWRRGGPRCAWPLTIGLGGVVLVSLSVTYGINLWNRHFFDALEAKDAATALHQALLFPLLIGFYLLLCVVAMAARMTMQRTWRAFLNGRLLDSWLRDGRYYQLECVSGDHRNPEHRIHDDLRIATDMPVDFATGFLTSLLSAVSFFAVLWLVGGTLTIPAGGTTISIPGFLVSAALLYAVLANGSMLLIARRFTATTERKNQAEAEYRYALTRVRENAESIALLRGDGAERAGLDHAFAGVFGRWRDLMFQHMRTVVVSQASAQMCGVIPVLLCTPRYLDGTMSLGQVMQLASAFTIVQGALSWLVDNYTRIADWRASARRVGALMAGLDRLDRIESARRGRIAHRDGDHLLDIRRLGVALPDGTSLVNGASAMIEAGEKVLLVGDSGTGKSALVRALGGCWPWGSGEVARRPSKLCVVPQRPYIPDGSLCGAVAYPLVVGDVAREEIRDAVAAVGLGQFLPRLDENLPWDRMLSVGEKQRLAFARLLIHRPDIVVLDEATSALHVQAQTHLMELIAARLPHAAVLSIGHRPELAAFHRRRLTMQPAPGGARIVADEPIRSDAPDRRTSRRDERVRTPVG